MYNCVILISLKNKMFLIFENFVFLFGECMNFEYFLGDLLTWFPGDPFATKSRNSALATPRMVFSSSEA